MSTPDFVAAAPYGAYIFLGMMCVIAIFYVGFFVPETKNRTLDELDEMFGDKSGRSKWEAELMLQAQREVGLLDVADIEPKRAGLGDKRSDSYGSDEKEADSV